MGRSSRIAFTALISVCPSILLYLHPQLKSTSQAASESSSNKTVICLSYQELYPGGQFQVKHEYY